MANEQLAQAIELAKTGRKIEAQAILSTIVKQEPRNEMAWLWLSYCADDIEKKKYCLQKILEVNPNNLHARQAWEQLNPVQASPAFQNQGTIRRQTVQFNPQKPAKKKSLILLILILCAAALIFACVVAALFRNSNPELSALPATRTAVPTKEPVLVVIAGELSKYTDEISRNRVVNVYKKDGTLDQRADDLKELCLDYRFYVLKIKQAVANGDNTGADKARASFTQVNEWLSVYNEDDVQTMLALIIEKKW